MLLCGREQLRCGCFLDRFLHRGDSVMQGECFGRGFARGFTRDFSGRGGQAAVLAAAVGVLAVMSGCWTFTTSDLARATNLAESTPVSSELAPDAWPARDVEVVRPLIAATPEKIFTYQYLPGIDPSTMIPELRKMVEEPEVVVRYSGVHGQGLLRVYEGRKGSFFDQILSGFTPNASFVTSRTLTDPRAVEYRAQRLEERTRTDALPSEFPGKPKQVEQTYTSEDAELYSGMQVRIPEKRDTPYRGVMLHFPAIFGNEYERDVMAEFVKRGWAVVDLKPPGGIRPPVPEADRRKINELRAEAKKAWEEAVSLGSDIRVDNFNDLRFGKYRALQGEIVRLEGGSFQACPGADLNEIAREIAGIIDQDLAGSAYATEAVVDYLRTQRPDLPRHPMVAVGFSAGAIATPTVVTRVRESLDAVVLIGGGANAFFLSQHSSFTDGGVRVRCGKDKVAPEVIDRLDELYIQHSKLDPYHTAPLLRGLPMLVVDARRDTWVPAAGGELLFDRLGRPDRLTIGADHDLLFYFLPWKAGVIADWLEKAVGKGLEK